MLGVSEHLPCNCKSLSVLLFNFVAFQLFNTVPEIYFWSGCNKVATMFWNCKSAEEFVFLHTENVIFVHRAQSSTKSPPRSIRKLLKRWNPSSSKFFTLSQSVLRDESSFVLLSAQTDGTPAGVHLELFLRGWDAATLSAFLEQLMKACWWLNPFYELSGKMKEIVREFFIWNVLNYDGSSKLLP